MINSTAGLSRFEAVSQLCLPCGPMNYIVDPHFGGTCQECPKVTFRNASILVHHNPGARARNASWNLCHLGAC